MRHACTCMSGALFARVWLFLWRCAACFGVACYGVFAACLRFLVFCIPAEIAACAMPSKLRSMAFYSLACVYICLCRFGAFYACFCGVWRAIESGILLVILRGSPASRIAAGAVAGNNYVTHSWKELCKPTISNLHYVYLLFF